MTDTDGKTSGKPEDGKKPDLSGVIAALNEPEAVARRAANERKDAEEHPEAVDRRPYFDASGKYLPNEAGQWLIDNGPVVKFGPNDADGDNTGNNMYYWTGLRYSHFTRGSVAILNLNRRSTPYERAATFDYIYSTVVKDPEYPRIDDRYDPFLIAFSDGTVYDARLGETRKITRDDFIISCVPWPYEDNPKDREALKGYLESLSDEPEFPDMIAEAVGLCLYGKTDGNSKSYLLYGPKSNGKSVLCSGIKNALGPDNYATLNLFRMATDPYATGNLAWKRAAIYEELPDRPIDEVGQLKDLITQEGWTVANPKKKEQYPYYPMTTVIGATNTLPHWRDPTGAMAKRMIVIDMVKDFSEDSPLNNPGIPEMVNSPRFAKAFLAAGCEALTRLYENGWKFTRSASVIRNNEALLLEGDMFRTYISEVAEEAGVLDTDPFYPFIGHKISDLYADFRNRMYADGLNMSRCPSVKVFTREMCARMGAVSSPRKDRDGNRFRIFACKRQIRLKPLTWPRAGAALFTTIMPGRNRRNNRSKS